MGFGKTLWVITRRLLMVATFGVVFIISAALAYYFTRGKEQAVPNVVGQTEEQAKQTAASIGLKVEVIDSFDSPEAPGKVIRQLPKAGSIIRSGGYTILKINVSRSNKTTKPNEKESRNLIPPDPPIHLTPWSEDLCGTLIAFDASNSSRSTGLPKPRRHNQKGKRVDGTRN